MPRYGVLYIISSAIAGALFAALIFLPLIDLGVSIATHADLEMITGGASIIVSCIWFSTIAYHFYQTQQSTKSQQTFFVINLVIGVTLIVQTSGLKTWADPILIILEIIILAGAFLRKYPELILGFVLLILGTVGRDRVWPWTALIICLGVTLVVGVLWQQLSRRNSKRLQIAILIGLLIAGGCFTLRAALVFLLDGRTTTYRLALVNNISSNPEQEVMKPLEDETRWIVWLDPTFAVGYANWGVVLYSKKNYKAGAEAFQNANQNNPVFDDGFLDCQAFGYYMAGERHTAHDLIYQYLTSISSDRTLSNFPVQDSSSWCHSKLLGDYQNYRDYLAASIP